VKQIEKTRRKQQTEAEKTNATPRFIWTEAATLDLLDLVSKLKNEHEIAEEQTPGFIPWIRFFQDNIGCKNQYETLKSLSFDTISRRYKVLVTTYKVSFSTSIGRAMMSNNFSFTKNRTSETFVRKPVAGGSSIS